MAALADGLDFLSDLLSDLTSGDQTDTVRGWVEELNFDGPVDQFKEYLDGFGCWDDEELNDHEENKQRVLWIWAGYCLDDPDGYDYLLLD